MNTRELFPGGRFDTYLIRAAEARRIAATIKNPENRRVWDVSPKAGRTWPNSWCPTFAVVSTSWAGIRLVGDSPFCSDSP